VKVKVIQNVTNLSKLLWQAEAAR